jgi:hypothetical protein
VGSNAVKEHLLKKRDTRRPVPTQTFGGALNLQIGGVTINLKESKTVAHQHGETIVYFPQAKALMFVDVAFPGWVSCAR